MRSKVQEAPLYVEFAGLPGAGKSTVFDEVQTILRKTHYRVVYGGKVVQGERVVHEGRRSWTGRSRLERFFIYLLLHVRFRALARALYAHLRGRGAVDRSALRAVRSVLLSVDRRQSSLALLRTGVADVVMADQGLVNYFREIAATGPLAVEPRLERAIAEARRAMAPVRWLVVEFVIDPETTVARIRQRPVDIGPYDRMCPVTALETLAHQAPYLRLVIDHLQNTGACDDVLTVDAASSPQETAKLIAGRILRMLEVRPPIAIG